MNKHKSNKIRENSNTVRHLIMGPITTTQNLVAIKEVRHAGQLSKNKQAEVCQTTLSDCVIVRLKNSIYSGPNLKKHTDSMQCAHVNQHIHSDEYIYVCCCWFRFSATGKGFSNTKETNCLPLLNAGFEPRVSGTESPAKWMPTDKPTGLSRIHACICAYIHSTDMHLSMFIHIWAGIK